MKGLNNLVKEVLRGFFYLAGSFPLSKQLVRNAVGIGNILTFHRVLPDDQARSDFTGNSVGVSQFEAALAYLSTSHEIVSLEDLLSDADVRHGRKTRVAITFDDGYVDTLQQALPILEKYRARATLYVSTSFLEGTAHLWWYSLLEAVHNRQSLVDPVTGRVLPAGSEEEKRGAYRRLWTVFKPAERRLQIKYFARMDVREVDPKKYSLTAEQLRELVASGVFEIGGHTHSHGNFEHMSSEEIIHDIEFGNRVLCADLGLKSVSSFAYPYGKWAQVSRGRDLLNDLGVRTAVTTEISCLSSRFDRLALPRHSIGPQNCSVSRIRTRLSGWNAFWGVQI